ncbi:MAG: redoxin domain-containing protein [Chloroflexi bacterium]|nr:redoxin domain-containing protein [Chloroflexota bacterium]MCH8309926.1 redoxin domain-containing protein [Chloroflexota bacterium]
MPVWQQLYEDMNLADSGVEILSVAMDAQGAEFARPFVEKAKAEFPTVVDRENHLGQLYRFKAIPNGYLINEEGVVEYRRLGGFDIRQPETRRIVEEWIGKAQGALESPDEDELGDAHDEANSLFRQGLDLYENGEVDQAMNLWRKGVELEPDNYIIRKQIWAVENPDRFYDDKVDFDWQREQMKIGR